MKRPIVTTVYISVDSESNYSVIHVLEIPVTLNPNLPSDSRLIPFELVKINRIEAVIPKSLRLIKPVFVVDKGIGIVYPEKMMKRVLLHGSSRFYEYPRKKRAVAIMEKVDAVAYPHNNNTGEKYMHYSVTNCTDQLYESRKEKFSDVTTHVPETIEEPGYSYSNPSSVGSCSVIGGSANNFCNNTLAGPCFEDDDSLHSDAEYVEDFDEIQSHMLAGPYQSEEDTLCIVAESLDVEDLSKEAVAERIHRLELNAYLCTLGVMYASGPLSWEKEELLTNLRISLNISNDEHLMGIKNLVFSGQNF